MTAPLRCQPEQEQEHQLACQPRNESSSHLSEWNTRNTHSQQISTNTQKEQVALRDISWANMRLLVLLLLACCCCCNSNATLSLKLFKEGQDNERDASSGEARAPSMFESNPVNSGARSAYQLAPFGDGFGFADLFTLFSQRDTKQTSKEGVPFALDDNLISNYDEQTPLMIAAGHNQKSPATSAILPLATTTSRRLSLAAPWNRILSIGGSGGDIKLDANESNAAVSGIRPPTPVILVPGYGGSRLEAKLDKPSSVHYFCDSKTDWTDMWINVKQLLPYMIDCLIDNMRLEFDPTTNKTRNPVGVDIRIKNGSQVASVEYLNNLQISGFGYFAPIIEQLTLGKLNYKRELNIRAAPYDFRKAPNELGEYFDNLKESSEQLVRDNGGRPISFICHSMGCNNMLYFLHRQSDEWKSKYVRRLISVAAPWAGSVSAMRAAAVGDDLGMPYLFSESKLLLVQRSLPSTIFLFPHKQVFSGVPLVKSYVDNVFATKDTSLAKKGELQQPSSDNLTATIIAGEETKLINTSPNEVSTIKQQQQLPQKEVYTADDFKKFFEDINHPDGYGMWLNTKDLLGSLEAPGVEVWCLVGVGKRTLARIEYSGEFPTSSSQEIYDDGDGTVTIQSADYCKRWSLEQQRPIYYKQFENDHLAILKNANVMQYIERILDSDLERAN